MKFTDKYIASLKPGEKQFVKREGKGFAIRVLPTGVKTWLFIYTFDGKRRQMNLGSYPDKSLADAHAAHAAAFSILNDKQNPRDPQEERDQKHKSERQARETRRLTSSVEDFIKVYIEGYAQKSIKRWEDVQRALKVEVLPRWGSRKITDITRRDIIVLRDEIAERAPIMANRVLAYVSGMFAYALDEDVIKISPYAKIKRTMKEEPKKRALSPDEIKLLWSALEGDKLLMSDETRTALMLILLTAQRPGEVVGMHEKEINGHWWTIPGSRTKNKRTHRVYLTDTALLLIGDMKGKGYRFPAGRGKEDGCMTVNALSFALRRNIKGQSTRTDKVKKRKGKEYKRGPYQTNKPLPEDPNRIGIEMFSPHDLRRTAATLMAAERVLYETRERVLNHTMGKLDDTYNQHDYDGEKQMAMETLERKVNSILTSAEGKVISIQKGKKAANH
jgi:integrase